jgi:diguanylate cyclase (GGDEF)-like protein
MELRNYIRILRKWWWLIIPLTLVALTIAMIIGYRQPTIYQTSSTYVTRLDSGTSSASEIIYGLDTLTSRTSLFQTYCEVLTSQNVLKDAYNLINVDRTTIDLAPYSANCTVLPDTNVLLLIVMGPSPALTDRINQAIGLVGMAHANTLYRFFGLQGLDTATTKAVTTASNRTQTGLLGGILGLTVSIALAFLLEYLRSPAERLDVLALRDPILGVYNKRYFSHRLAEEISRARIRNRPVCVALLRLTPTEDFSLLPEEAQNTMVRSAAQYINDSIRETDLLATLGNNIIAIMLPETPPSEARAVISGLHAQLRLKLFADGDYTTTFTANTGLVEASGGLLDVKTMLEKASEALRGAEESRTQNTIQMVRTSPMPFDFDELPTPTNPPGVSPGKTSAFLLDDKES